MNLMADTTVLGEREILATRLLDAPRDLVFKVWTDTEHLHQWWGPTGFTTTTRQAKFAAGGQWRFTMHGPDGRDYGNLITFLEVDPPRRLVYRHGGEKEFEPVNFKVEVDFEEVGRRTKLTMRLVFESKHTLDFVVKEHGAFEGLKQTMGRLADHLAAQDAFVLRRTLDAPLDLVWAVHTELGHLKKWWAPKGFETFHATQELRPGGMYHYGMRTAQGQEMWGRFVYREILPKRRLVWVNSFSDPQGGLARHAMSENWPLEMLVTITFAESGGKTALELRVAAINASDEERRVFKEGYKGMEGGFGGTYDALDALLAELRR